jgi:hypothetical protein
MVRDRSSLASRRTPVTVATVVNTHDFRVEHLDDGNVEVLRCQGGLFVGPLEDRLDIDDGSAVTAIGGCEAAS